jgi:tetratricopeptide (TPR) repeat protein
MILLSLRRPALLTATAICLLLSAALCMASTDESWKSVSSPNFLLVSNTDEREMRLVTQSLEEFRAAISQLPFAVQLETQRRTTVIMFRSRSDYRPFAPLLLGGKPSVRVAGHFQTGPEMDYIALSADEQDERSPSSVAIHEYVHALIKHSFRRAPVWLNEGLAEYYSTFELSIGYRKALLGRQIESHAQYLSEQELIPLETLLAVDPYSPYYDEPEKRRLFYAQSWALVHYLLNGRPVNGSRELARFLELQASGISLEECVRQAFQMELKGLEKELARYVGLARYAAETASLSTRAQFNPALHSDSLTEAEAAGYLGSLLVQSQRYEEAEKHLQKALSLNPNLSRARLALGLLCLEQNRYHEALEHLQRGIKADPENYLAHYYYADALERDGQETDKSVTGFIKKTALIRGELKRSIELEPNFAESYRLLAEIDLKRSPQVDETIAMLRLMLARWPKREEFTLLLAEAHMRKGEYATSRAILDALAIKSYDPLIIARTQNLRATIATHEESVAAHRQVQNAETRAAEADWESLQPCDMPEPGPQVKRLRFMGRQVCGQLTKIECEAEGSVLFVEAEGRTLRLHSDNLRRISFVTYTSEIKGRVECGERASAVHVLVTYRPAKDAASLDGEVIAVEFVPPDWNH